VKKQHIPIHIRRQVIERDGLYCVYCDDDLSDQEVHLDHIIPESQSGPTTVDNLQVTCRRCNTAKGVLTEDEFVNRLRIRAQNILWRLGSK
jgi:5-methylcytosine-specific restriction endonuclease McrA